MRKTVTFENNLPVELEASLPRGQDRGRRFGETNGRPMNGDPYVYVAVLGKDVQHHHHQLDSPG